MPNVNFDSDNQQSNYSEPDDGKEGITGWLQSTFNVSRKLARNILLTIGIIALIVSLYFWAQLLL
jgi:hypothetical protein